MLPWWVRKHGYGPLRSDHAPGRGQPLRRFEPDATGASDMEEFVRALWRQRRDAKQRGNRPSGYRTAMPAADVAFEWRLDRRMRDAALTGPGLIPAGRCGWRASSSCGCGTSGPTSRGCRLVGRASGGVFHVYPIADFCHNRRVANTRPGLAVHTVLAAGGVPDDVHVVFVSSIRYREPAMLALLALAAGEWAVTRWRKSGQALGRETQPRESGRVRETGTRESRVVRVGTHPAKKQNRHSKEG